MPPFELPMPDMDASGYMKYFQDAASWIQGQEMWTIIGMIIAVFAVGIMFWVLYQGFRENVF